MGQELAPGPIHFHPGGRRVRVICRACLMFLVKNIISDKMHEKNFILNLKYIVILHSCGKCK